jgi:hypothetical protein
VLGTGRWIPLHNPIAILERCVAIGRLNPLRLSLCSRYSRPAIVKLCGGTSVYTREGQGTVYLINVRFASVKVKVHRQLPVSRKTADTTA